VGVWPGGKLGKLSVGPFKVTYCYTGQIDDWVLTKSEWVPIEFPHWTPTMKGPTFLRFYRSYFWSHYWSSSKWKREPKVTLTNSFEEEAWMPLITPQEVRSLLKQFHIYSTFRGEVRVLPLRGPWGKAARQKRAAYQRVCNI